MSDLVVLVPVLKRPHRVRSLLDSINAATPGARILFIADPDDREELAALDAAAAERIIYAGGYARKINEGVRRTDEPLIFLGADDLAFRPGWLEAATARLGGRVGVIGTNDLGNKQVLAGRHATHSLVTRAYVSSGTIDEPDRLLHEGYDHNFVDNEFTETAQKRSAWRFARRSIVEHLHPNWQKAQGDETYAKGQRNYEIDRKLFRARRCLWS